MCDELTTPCNTCLNSVYMIMALHQCEYENDASVQCQFLTKSTVCLKAEKALFTGRGRACNRLRLRPIPNPNVPNSILPTVRNDGQQNYVWFVKFAKIITSKVNVMDGTDERMP